MWSDSQLKAFVDALNAGEVAIAPAEGVYGYCADPFNDKALEKIIALKQRSKNKGLITLVPNLQTLPQICGDLDAAAEAAIKRYWQLDQIATTLLLPPSASTPKLLMGGFDTVSVRLPQVDYMQQYMQAWGKPLVSTSLNIAGEPPATEVTDAPAGVAALTLPEPLHGQPSRIYNPATEEFLR